MFDSYSWRHSLVRKCWSSLRVYNVVRWWSMLENKIKNLLLNPLFLTNFLQVTAIWLKIWQAQIILNILTQSSTFYDLYPWVLFAKIAFFQPYLLIITVWIIHDVPPRVCVKIYSGWSRLKTLEIDLIHTLET